MRLFTHSFLQRHAKECAASGKNIPLAITLPPPSEDGSLEIVMHREQVFSEPFIRGQLNKFAWTVLVDAAERVFGTCV